MAEATKPSPGVYLRLAKTCSDIGEFQLAVDVCDRGLARFTKDIALHTMKGEIFLKIYNLKKNIEHLKSALGHFEKALGINPSNYLSLLRTANIYLLSGSLDKARQRVEKLLEVSPEDEHGKVLLQKLRQKDQQAAKRPKVEVAKPAGEKPVPPPKEPESEEGGEVVIRDDDEMGDVEAADYENLANRLSLFSRIEGLKGLFLVDKYGMPIKTVNRSELDESLVASLLSNVYRSSFLGIRRMGFGSFQRGQVMTPVGNIYLVNAGYAVLGILMDADTNPQQIETRINTYLEEIIT